MTLPPGPLAAGEHAVFSRPRDLSGVEVLRAQFVTHRYLPHAHDALAVALIERGAERYRYRGAAVVAAAGQLAVVPPGEVHTGAAASPGGWAYQVAYLDRAWLHAETGGQDIGFRAPVLADEALSRVWRLAHAALANPAASPLTRETLLRAAVAGLVAQAGDHTWAPERTDHAAVRDTRTFLEAHPETTLTLSALSARVGLSASHLSRSFSAAVGAPPHTYLLGVRVQRARELLRAGESISGAAAQLGFADQAHLTRVFRRVVGVPPGVYARAK